MATTLIATLVTIYLINECKSSIHPQYGFCHRVNNPEQISSVLNNGANGIEIDICYGRNTDNIEDWYVSHSDLDYCHNSDAVSLTAWLTHLKCLLFNNPSYINQFAMLWLDIKDPAEPKLNQVPKIVQSMGFPPHMKVLYDLTKFNAAGKSGFDAIAPRLHRNEGITFCAGKSCRGSKDTVRDMYEYYKAAGFWRGTFNSGDSVNIDENFLIYANSKNFNEPADPFRFKLIFSWTHNKENEIQAQINPSNEYHTDGQIFGDWTHGWNNDEKYIKMFSDTINRYSSRERFAMSNDNPFVNYNRHDYRNDGSGRFGFLVDINGQTIDITDEAYVALQSVAHGGYITVYSDGSVDASGVEVTRSEKFVWYEVSTVNYLLHLSNYYLAAVNSNGYPVEASSEWPSTAERWRVERFDDGSVALKSYYNKYLTVRASGQVDASAVEVGSEQKFKIVPWLSWLEPGESNFTTTQDTDDILIPTVLPTKCPTSWPIEQLTKEEKSWFLAGIIFIVLTIISIMILCYLGCSVYRKSKAKISDEKTLN